MDLQNAYDTVEWYALECILREMSFPPQFTQWIMMCVTTVSYRYSIQGRHSRILKAKRGLRQGDPISPLLFVLIMEYLHRCLSKLKSKPMFKLHPKCEKVDLTNICFADDLILFARGDINSVQLMMEEVRSAGTLPFKYLGVPITSRKLHIALYQPLINKIVQRMSSWTASLLSYAGRWLLIQSVIQSMTAYWMQIYPMPKKVIHHIGAICRTFLWCNKSNISKKSPISWESIREPRNAGGLNLVELNCWNKATIIKLLWNLQAKADKLWVLWMHTYYLKGNEVNHWHMPSSCSWIMRKMLSYREELENSSYWHSVVQAGKYKTKHVYNELRCEKPNVPWYKIFYQNAARPRAKFILWIDLWDRLPTKSRLARFGIITYGECVFCGKEETQEHLRFACVFTGKLWRTMLNWIGMDRVPHGWRNEKAWICMETSRKGWRRLLLKAVIT
ncbi:uncharacterized protein LOC131658815 [Vicia villosa]|uniref:uncharacterized protein LOC131658815 n=1 Tax=Vicia villosa TaxID=3911 RepID=UPI00273BCA40|nr:uncharacterized protein LOC131658815 [Vicia villosa]